jgi:hypothetical protein
MTVLLAATVLIAVAAPLSYQDESTSETTDVTRLPAQTDAPRGMRIHLDEQGRPIAPPANDSRAAVGSSNVIAAPPAELEELDTPRGGKMVVLDGRFQPYSVARIRSDGTLAVGCDRSGDHGHTTEHQPAACPADGHAAAATNDAGASE